MFKTILFAALYAIAFVECIPADPQSNIEGAQKSGQLKRIIRQLPGDFINIPMKAGMDMASTAHELMGGMGDMSVGVSIGGQAAQQLSGDLSKIAIKAGIDMASTATNLGQKLMDESVGAPAMPGMGPRGIPMGK